MTALYLAELRRIASRRLVRLTVLLAAVAVAAGGVFAFAQHSPPPVGDMVKGASGILALVSWGLGASIVGAEFASRGMTTLLTFETRRSRVFAAKTAAVLTAAAVFGVVVLVALALALVPTAVAHHAPLTAGDPSLATLAGVLGRGTALVMATAAIGFAIAALGRNTAAALGVGFGYIVVLENILGNALAGWRPWLLLGNVIVFISGHNGGGEVAGRSVLGAGLFLGAIAAVALALAAGSFRTRDIA